jgi:hypothetical protein
MRVQLDISASDLEPGVIVFHVVIGDLNIPVRLAGDDAKQFAEKFGRAYLTAFADQCPATVREQIEAQLEQMIANLGRIKVTPNFWREVFE